MCKKPKIENIFNSKTQLHIYSSWQARELAEKEVPYSLEPQLIITGKSLESKKTKTTQTRSVLKGKKPHKREKEITML